MAKNLSVVALSAWDPGGNLWWSTYTVTLLNLTDQDVVNPEIKFTVGAGQTIVNHYGLVWSGVGADNTITGRLVAERKTIPARGEQKFQLAVQGNGQTLGPLPTGFLVNGQDANPPADDKEPPSKPTGLKAVSVGSKLLSLAWTPSTDNVAVAGYVVTYNQRGRSGAQKVTTRLPQVTLKGLAPATTYTVHVVAFDLTNNQSARSDVFTVQTAVPLPDQGHWDVRRAPFIDFTAYPTPQVTKYQEESGLDGFFLGFLVARPGGDKKVYWGGFPSMDDSNTGISYPGDLTVSNYGKDDMKAFTANGGKVVLSFGGASNVPLEAEETDVAKIVATYEGILRNFVIDGKNLVTHFDFDFEGAFIHDPVGQDRHVAAISQVLAKHPYLKTSYTLPVDGAPGSLEGFNEGGVKLLQKLADAGVEPSLINGMLMEFGQTSPEDAYDCCVLGLKGMHRQISSVFTNWDSAKVWRRIGACPMFGKHINGKEFTLANMDKLIAFANDYDIGCLSGWDATRDRNQGLLPECDVPNGQDLAKCTYTEQDSFDFGKRISNYKQDEQLLGRVAG
ncbi:fibronectin type III domain-containing protein [Myxococcus fulvus]|uniref:fibronectin type III domain-containing protein n=1 Tax=Myxococcus fulvus TaxID=33 RepID=UPI003B9C3CAD